MTSNKTFSQINEDALCFGDNGLITINPSGANSWEPKCHNTHLEFE